MGDIESSIQALRAFRDERDWAQFHDSKNLASALKSRVSVESESGVQAFPQVI